MKHPLLRLASWSLALAISCGASGLAANPLDIPLESLLDMHVTSASKRPQKPADAPSMVSVLTADEIRRFGWRKLDEALASLPGVHVSHDRSYTYLGVRGFARPGDYNARLLMLVDGVPINDGVYDQAPVGSEFPVDLALVERIEYVPGPGSVLYGGNAFLGVVNVVTTAGARHGSQIEAGYGSGRAWEIRAVVGDRNNEGDDWLVGVMRNRRRGDDLFFAPYAGPGANAVSHGLDHEASDRLLARFVRGGFSAGLLAHERRKGVPGGAYGADLDDPRNAQMDRRMQVSLRYERHLSPGLQLSLAGWGGVASYRGDWSYGGAVDVDRFENQALGGEARLMSTALPRQVVVAGLSLRRDGIRRQTNQFMDSNVPRGVVGLFAQDDWAVTERIDLSLGLRHDAYSGGQRFTSRRLALIARPWPATVVKLIGGTAFRPPNAYETDYVYGGTNIANPSLNAESILTRQLGLEHRFDAHSHIAAALYRNWISNLITPELDPLTGVQQHQNVGRVITEGLELTGHTAIGEIGLRGSLSWQQAWHESGTELPNTPRQLAKLLVSMPLPGGVGAGWETHYTGRRLSDSGDVRIAGTPIGGHAVSHLTFSGRAAGMDWQLRVANIFGRRYGEVVGTEFSAAFPGAMITPMPTMQQDGRALFLRLRWEH